jgi:HSP20 family protein
MAKESKKEQSETVPAKTGGKGPVSMSEEAWHPLVRLQAEMERLFEDFQSIMPFPFGGRGGALEPLRTAQRMFGALAPAVSLAEKEDSYELTAELPGLDEKDVQVTLRDDVLTIKGEKQEEAEEKTHGYYFSERRFGSFNRSFRLTDDVDPEKIEARFKNGVLTVTLPKNPAAVKEEKKIAIKGE